MTRGRVAGALALLLGLPVAGGLADSPVGPKAPAARPQAWLVVYNSASDDSRAWALWYQHRRRVPAENMLGLPMSTDEHLPDRAAARAQVFDPVREYLAANPALEDRIMGILVGYGVPGHYGEVPYGPPGGYSIANGLQDLTNERKDTNEQCAQLDGELPPRLRKQTLLPGHYLVGRIDAANLELAMQITLRAQAIEDPAFQFGAERVWYDYRDGILPNGEWYWLHQALDSGLFDELPWAEFDADTEQTPGDAFRFGTHDVDGWNDERLFGFPRGARVLAYNLNSWGATTVRDPDAEGGRFVPNAIRAGYAAAIGATGEPNSVIGPFPWVLLAAVREGWTLGEAMYLANPYDDWVWTCIGDPLLSLPCWLEFSPDDGKGFFPPHDGQRVLDDHAPPAGRKPSWNGAGERRHIPRRLEPSGGGTRVAPK